MFLGVFALVQNFEFDGDVDGKGGGGCAGGLLAV